MANTEKKYKISIDANDAKKTLTTIGKGFKALGKAGTATLKGLGKAGKVAFKTLGTAIKGAGIGVLIGLFSTLWEALKQNQKIMDLVSDAVNTMGIFIAPLVDGITSLVEKMGQNKELMEKTKGVIKNLLDVALTPLKLSFYAIKLGIEGAQLIWKKSFLGGKGKDVEGIKKLEESIQSTKDSIKDVAVTAVNAAKDFTKNIGGVVTGVSSIVKDVAKETADAYANISVQSAINQAKAMTQAKKNLETLALEQEKVVKLAETEAEKRRQIRDDDTLTFAERIQANKDLADILNKQSADEKAIIARKIEEQKKLNALDEDNEDGKNALLALQNELLDVDARITGQLSEQKTNVNALDKERADAAQAELDRLQEVADAKKAIEDKAREDKKIADEETAQLILDERDAKIQAASDAINSIKSLDENATQFKKNLLKRQLDSGEISQEEYDKKLAAIEEKAAKRQKAYAIAQTIINTAAAMISALAEVPKFDFGISAGLIAAGIGVMGAAQVAMIASTPISGGGGGSTPTSSFSGGSGSGSGVESPSTSFTFDDKNINKEAEAPVIKTFVVAKDVETQSQMDRNIAGNGVI